MGTRERRDEILREDMEPENEHDFEITLGTFERPRYEIVPTGDGFDGAEADAATILSQLGLVRSAPSLQEQAG